MVPLVPMLEKSLFFSSYFSISTRVSRKLFSAIWAKILNFVGHEFDLKSKNDFYKIQNLICHWNSIFQLSNYKRVFLNIFRTYVCTVREYVFNTLYLIWHFKGTVSRDFLLQFFYDSYPIISIWLRLPGDIHKCKKTPWCHWHHGVKLHGTKKLWKGWVKKHTAESELFLTWLLEAFKGIISQ